MISCKQSTEYIIQKEHGKLSPKQHIQLLSHMTVCSYCRLFKKQSLIISKAFQTSSTMDIKHLTLKEKEELLRNVELKIAD
jgi:hypothetical protein